MALESAFQGKLIKEIKRRFPGAMVMKTDPNYIQGLPDLLVLYQDHWATLECKRTRNAHCQPNQEYYVDHMNQMSFSRFIFPENKEEVLREMEHAFRPTGEARLSGSEQVPLDTV